ncbi:MAG TPA: gliding motility-associated C-terminal domain-containing protein [Chitinophaga sp.]|uniref:T9SS type B sorting domain-containing protein n=1 Tax=Chitinophaga sp. TaxID=1869181 RepID=UPI002D01CB00|nr:gliding motility-associated C-terminal domain-containing protein [Chitinophaga sp.]HVI48616.1 gliding motility-associated C-terminal domain-containing protein [Chitinophaga sp.]
MLTFTTAVSAQCTTIGQNPSTAFPVCGTQTFKQLNVPSCFRGVIPGPSCANVPGDGPHEDRNPFWYKFTCYTAGTLGFTITPISLIDDYDWQIFDVTGHNPDDVYTDISMLVGNNWSGEKGVTGTSATAQTLTVCGGPGQPLFSAMPTLKQGHDYLLLISNFSNSQVGYELTFAGGTANITDPTMAHVKGSGYNCGPITVGVKLNKKLKCNSLAADGSDFAFSPAGPKILGATGVNCNNGFDMDSVLLQLDQPLAPGSYTVISQKGTDGNTLLDACGNSLPTGEATSFIVVKTPPVDMGKVNPLPCGPNEIQIAFSSPFRCASVVKDGSDFILSGPSTVGINGATVNCGADGLAQLITLQLDKRIVIPGDYRVTLRQGTDGNTLESDCHVFSTPGGAATFHIDPQPAVLLGNTAPIGCNPSTIKIGLSVPVRCASIAADGSDFTITGTTNISIKGATGICNASNLADSIVLQLSDVIRQNGNYTIRLQSGGDGNTLESECWQPAAAGQQVSFRTADNVSAAFTYTVESLCKNTTVNLAHNGLNSVNSWTWSFDDGEVLREQNPVKKYFGFGQRTIRLIVSNGVCADTSSQSFEIKTSFAALFDVSPGPYCPLDIVAPVNKSYGDIISWKWEYGNGAVTTSATPQRMQYFPTRKEQDYHIRLIAENTLHCLDTADHVITAVSSCYIDVPTAFTPNNDGNNDYLYPLSAYKAVDLYFAVFNRSGQLLFETTDWKKRWDGTVKGQPADVGTYVWMLRYTEKESGKKVLRKGTTVLIR